MSEMRIIKDAVECYVCDRCGIHIGSDSPRAIGMMQLTAILMGVPQDPDLKLLCVNCRADLEDFMRGVVRVFTQECGYRDCGMDTEHFDISVQDYRCNRHTYMHNSDHDYCPACGKHSVDGLGTCLTCGNNRAG